MGVWEPPVNAAGWSSVPSFLKTICMHSYLRSSGHGGRAGAMKPSRGTFVVLVLLLLSSTAMRPSPAAAQKSYVIAGHVGRSAFAPGGAMVDVATELRQGLVGLRLGVGMDVGGTALAPLAPTTSASGAWTTDLDLGLNLARVPYADVLLGRSDPTVFLGAGGVGVSTTDADTEDGSRAFVPTWSFGARGGVPVTSWLGFEVEARRRAPLEEVDPSDFPTEGGWEYRAGVALRFGGRPAARVQPVPRRDAEPTSTTRRPLSEPHTTSPAVTVAAPVDEAHAGGAELLAMRAIETADQYVGSRYRWGGASPSEGFDCSGFVQYVFRQHGIQLPRVSRDQARAGRAQPISLDGLAPGDLLFFAQGGPTVDHVAIYAGDGRIVHASRSGYGVRYDELTGDRGRWYARHLVAVRRVIDDEMFASTDVQTAAADMPQRELPLEDAFEALESGDEAAPPPQ